MTVRVPLTIETFPRENQLPDVETIAYLVEVDQCRDVMKLIGLVALPRAARAQQSRPARRVSVLLLNAEADPVGQAGVVEVEVVAHGELGGDREHGQPVQHLLRGAVAVISRRLRRMARTTSMSTERC